jgi:hypothetical protein
MHEELLEGHAKNQLGFILPTLGARVCTNDKFAWKDSYERICILIGSPRRTRERELMEPVKIAF